MKHDIEALDSEGLKHFQTHIENQKKDIKLMAINFEAKMFAWKSFEEMDAFNAQQNINMARRRIIELQDEIEKQHLAIQKSQLVIKKFKNNQNAGQLKKVGKPQISETQKTIVKGFMATWIHSLMDALEVKNCRKLEEVLEADTSLNSERNWRRWLNGDAIPTYKTFETLLHSKVAIGKFAKQPLLSITTTPLSEDLLTVIRFI